MKNNNVNEFLNHTTYEECAVIYHGKKYFFYGMLFNKNTKVYSYDIAQWDANGEHVKFVFQETADAADKLLEKFYAAPIWDGKTFWQAEQEMEWVDW